MNEAFNRVCRVLSYNEEAALKAVGAELSGDVTIRASTIADNTGVARSTLIGALRLLVAAGLVETWSLGRGGTRVRVLWPDLSAAIARLGA